MRAVMLGLALLAGSAVEARAYRVTGDAVLVRSGTTLPGVPVLPGVDLQGLPVSVDFRIDTGVPGFTFGSPATGVITNFNGAVTGFDVRVGSYRVARSPRSFSALRVSDDVVVGDLRIDQVGIFEGVVSSGGVITPLVSIDAPLPADVFLANFAFARSALGTAAAPPTLVTSTGFPELGAAFGPSSVFPAVNLNLQFRQGPLTALSQLPTLPVASFNASFTNLSVAAVPEPGTWAMLVAGFGMVGAALRKRQRAAVRRVVER